ATLQGDPAITPDQLARIRARTLIILGDNDYIPVGQAFEMYQNIPKARLWISPNGWHEPQSGVNQADFIRRTTEFLEGEWDKVSR
ncbi:MAG: alpha/beta hydrolase, partial [Marivirga sp.]|nr:alpha/beta hydrolase [Marivirga sp.]